MGRYICLGRVKAFPEIPSRFNLLARIVTWLSLAIREYGKVNVFAGHIITLNKIRVLLIRKEGENKYGISNK